MRPDTWSGTGLAVGLVTIAAMVLAPRVTRKVPAAILGLAAGVACYFAIGLLLDPRLLTLADNHLVIGQLGGSGASLARRPRWPPRRPREASRSPTCAGW